MKTRIELKADLKLAKAIKNKEWITQLDAKLEQIDEFEKLIDGDLKRLKKNLECMKKIKAEHHKTLVPYTRGQIAILEELKSKIQRK